MKALFLFLLFPFYIFAEEPRPVVVKRINIILKIPAKIDPKDLENSAPLSMRKINNNLIIFEAE